jgi:hypothetical protein
MWIKGNKPELEKIIEEGKLVKRKYDKLMTENKELLMSKSAVGDMEDNTRWSGLSGLSRPRNSTRRCDAFVD